MNTISKADVQAIAKSIFSIDLTEAQINQIIDEHESYCYNDPTGTWDLIVEQQILDVHEIPYVETISISLIVLLVFVLIAIAFIIFKITA